MTWSELDLSKSNKEESAIEAEKDKRALVKDYHACFKTEAGNKVMSDLVSNFLMNSGPNPGESNIEYRAAYQNGEAGVVKYIMSQIQRAEVL